MNEKPPKKTARGRVKDNHIGARLLPGDKERLARLAANDKRTVSYVIAWLIHNALNALDKVKQGEGV